MSRKSLPISLALLLAALLVAGCAQEKDLASGQSPSTGPPAPSSTVSQSQSPANQTALTPGPAKALSTEQLASFRKKASVLAGEGRSSALALVVKKTEVQDLAETALSNAEYEKQAPRESAICYRLYAASVLIAPQDDPMAKAKNALPWISRAIEVDPKVQDRAGLEEAESFVGRVAEGAMAQAALDEFFSHVFRIGMVEATDEEVASQTKGMIEGVKAMMSPQ